MNKLVQAVHSIIEMHTPLKKRTRKQKRLQQKPWITKGLLVSLKNKLKLHKNFFLHGDDFEKIFYKTNANKLTRVKNLSKKLNYNEAIFLKKIQPHRVVAIYLILLS